MEKRFEWGETGSRGVGGKLFPVQARDNEGWIRGWQWRPRTVDKCERYRRIENTGIGKECEEQDMLFGSTMAEWYEKETADSLSARK